MKAGTKLQREICKFSQKHLPKISVLEKKYADKHCLDHKAHLSKTGTLNCMDCGYSWKTNSPIDSPKWHKEILKEKVVCPSCKQELKIKETQKRVDSDYSSYGLITTCKGYQVIRYFEINGYSKTKKQKRIHYIERGQIWIAPNGKHEIIGYNSNMYSGRFFGDFSLKHRNNVDRYNSKPYVTYPRIRITKKIKRNGFYGNFLEETPYDIFKGLLTCNYTETLLKLDYISLLKYVLNNKHRLKTLKEYWSSIRIVIRHNYIIEDAHSYMDYLRFLKTFGKDLHSPKYVCPRDFDKEHNKYVEKMRVRRQKEENLRNIEKIKNDKKKFLRDKREYVKYISKFKDIVFHIPNVMIKPLMTLKEIERAGTDLKHCIFSSSYYNDRKSLLMCAYENDGRILETIQIDLNNFKVEQCRGLNNLPTIYNGDIINKVNDNMRLIKVAFKKKKIKTKIKVA